MENQPNELPWYELIKKEREQRSWTQAEVAEKIGVGLKTVGRWERGESFPLPLYRRGLATIYERSLHDLKLDEALDKGSHQKHPHVEENLIETENAIEKVDQFPEVTVESPDTGQSLRFVVRINFRQLLARSSISGQAVSQPVKASASSFSHANTKSISTE